MGSSELSSPLSICLDYDRPWKGCSVVSESVSYLIAELLQLTILKVECMSRKSVLEVCVGALELTLASNHSQI